jgi:23S rRNA (adenine2503-C2)-methyltransferase
MTSLPAPLRERLAAELPILAGKETARSTAPDRTTKLLLEFPREGGRDVSVETVHMPSLGCRRERRDRGAPARRGDTVRFDAGRLSDRLSVLRVGPARARAQPRKPRDPRAVRARPRDRRLARSVVMGMGEPLLNFQNLTTALDAVHDEMGWDRAAVTVSTVGFPDRLRKIAPSRPRFQLAISLHTPDQEQRDELVPAMRGVPIEDVLSAGDDWFERTGREITYEYVLLSARTTRRGTRARLAARLAGRRCTVNLIPYNPVEESPYRRPEAAAVETFRRLLARSASSRRCAGRAASTATRPAASCACVARAPRSELASEAMERPRTFEEPAPHRGLGPDPRLGMRVGASPMSPRSLRRGVLTGSEPPDLPRKTRIRLMKTPVLVAIGVSALALVAAAQKPEAAKPHRLRSRKRRSRRSRRRTPSRSRAGLRVSDSAEGCGAGPTDHRAEAGQPTGEEAIVRSRNLAKMIVNVERAHRDRVARLERLRQIYEKSGGAEQLERIARLRAKEHARYDAAMRGYERDLGPALFAKVRSALDLNAGKAPAPPAPTTAPVPNAPETPKQERGGARQKGRR